MSFKTIDKQFLNNSVYEQAKEPVFMVRKWGELNIKDKPVWEYDCGEAVAMVRCKNTVIISTNFTRDRQRNYIEAIDISNGNRLWSEPLLSAPLPWGLIVDRDGRIIVTLEDGQIMCFGQSNKDQVL